MKTPQPILEEYLICLEERTDAINKKRKELDKKISAFQTEYRTIDQDKLIVQKLLIKEKDLKTVRDMAENTSQYISSNIQTMLDFLSSEGFIVLKEEDDSDHKRNCSYSLSEKGSMAIYFKEVHCLVFANLLHYGMFDNMTSKQMIALFSCFTNISISEDLRNNIPYDNTVQKIKDMYDYYLEKENKLRLDTGTDYNMHFDLLEYVNEWTCVADEVSCKLLLQKMEEEKGIFLGEFVKALLKIVNIAAELEKNVEKNIPNNISLLHKLKEIPSMLLKYVVTNQSLYV